MASLQQEVMQIGQAMYGKGGAPGAPGAPGGPEGEAGAGAPGASKGPGNDGDVIDAEFTDKK